MLLFKPFRESNRAVLPFCSAARVADPSFCLSFLCSYFYAGKTKFAGYRLREDLVSKKLIKKNKRHPNRLIRNAFCRQTEPFLSKEGLLVFLLKVVQPNFLYFFIFFFPLTSFQIRLPQFVHLLFLQIAPRQEKQLVLP